MKKLLLTTAVVLGLSVAAMAQGTVNWNGVANLFIAQTNGGTYSTFAGGGLSTGSGSVGNTAGNTVANNTALGYQGYYYELLVSATASAAPTVVSGLSGWLDTGLSATNGAVSNGRIVQTAAQGVAGNQQAIANNWPVNATESVILVGWSANLGSSWSTVLNELQNWSTDGISGAYFGVSSMGSLAAQSGNPGVTVFGPGPGQINNPVGTPMVMNLLAVPEPGTIALAALGGASLLLFRRKK